MFHVKLGLPKFVRVTIVFVLLQTLTITTTIRKGGTTWENWQSRHMIRVTTHLSTLVYHGQRRRHNSTSPMVVVLKQRIIVATQMALDTPGATITTTITGNGANWKTEVRMKLPGTDNIYYDIVVPCKAVSLVLEKCISPRLNKILQFVQFLNSMKMWPR